jgi:hypothetical protein
MGKAVVVHRAWLVVEFVVLFVGLPLGFRYSPVRLPALPVLWVVAGYAFWQLWRDSWFDRSRLWNAAPLTGHLSAILGIFAVAAFLLWLGTHWLAPELQWSFLRQRPALWAAVMVFYPVLSVYPQGLLYRAFLMQRYGVLFSETPAGRWALIVVSAAAFGFLHIIFRNGLAMGLTFLGGILFAWRYAETGSLLTSSAEHALYGCWLFTVGLGQYFYHGAGLRPAGQ